MNERTTHVLERGSRAPLREAEARSLSALRHEQLPACLEAAASRRDRVFGRTLTFSPKVFLPLTNLCRNHCDYCTFRKSPGQAGEWTMRPDEVERWLEQGAEQGAVEALMCLGDRPETAFARYRRQLTEWGHADTVDLIASACSRALALGLLPHTNAGVLDAAELRRLRPLNVSMGLMLENVSPRLCEPGMPHHKARDKHPELRLAMTAEAGRQKIPFTSGILLGIGETRLERVESLLAIRAQHLRYGHIQEVIVQNFRSKPEIPMAHAPEPEDFEVAHAVAMARLILPDDVSVQAPPNLNPHATELLVRAGINDFGGISPVTPDYINPGHPWPHLDTLHAQCETLGFALRPRLAVYDRFVSDTWLDSTVHAPVEHAAARLSSVHHPRDLDGRGPRRLPWTHARPA